MDFIDQVKQFAARVAKMKDGIQTEEATKTPYYIVNLWHGSTPNARSLCFTRLLTNKKRVRQGVFEKVWGQNVVTGLRKRKGRGYAPRLFLLQS